MTTNPLISVIIPAHNRSDYLLACLKSVASQTYAPVEILVIDDASSEALEPVVNSVDWPDTYTVHYVRSDVNIGPGAAREMGRQHAQGAYIHYHDSDDLSHPDKLQALFQALQFSPDCGMAYCTTLYFGQWPLTGDEPVRNHSDRYFPQFLPTSLAPKRPWQIGACLWTRDATERIGPWLDTWNWEDHAYDVQAACHNVGIAFVNRHLFYQRRELNAERISRAKRGFVAHERTRSMLRIAELLEAHDKLEHPQTRAYLMYSLYNQSIFAVKYGEHILAARCLDFIRRFSESAQDRWLIGLYQHTLKLARWRLAVLPLWIAQRVKHRLSRSTYYPGVVRVWPPQSYEVEDAQP